MKKRKILQDLMIRDNFMFGMVMRIEESFWEAKSVLPQADCDGVIGER